MRRVLDALGRNATIAAVLAVIAGAIGFATGLGAEDRPRTYAALMASWVFFAGVAAGALAFRAFFQVVPARWAQRLEGLAGAQVGFAPVVLVVLLAIVLGTGAWLHADPESTWMSGAGVALRDVALTAALFGIGFVLRPGNRARAIVYLIAFAIVLSIWAFDLVLGADPVFESTMIGPLVFVGAFIAGAGFVIFLGISRKALDDAARRDAAGLMLALSIFWAYLFWAQYLTIWYGNLPEEVSFALRRVEGGWGAVVLAVIGLVFALPFVGLMIPAGRRSAVALRTLLVLQLAGFWLCCHLLIVPSLTAGDEPALAIRDVLIALGLLGAYALSVAARVVTPPPPAKETP